MANYNSLKSAIQEVIRTNGNNEITGAILQQTLLSIISSLGVGYQFIDVATPQTNPGTPDYNVVYIAFKTGTYSNFGGTVLRPGEIGIYAYNGGWTYKTAFLLSPVFDLNNPETRKNGYELNSIGVYSENALYNSSGDMEIVPDGNYQTNYTGHIFCYGENGNFIEFVDAGDPLPNGTAFVRINWFAETDAPYFCSFWTESLQTKIEELEKNFGAVITALRKEIYDLNSPDTRKNGYELTHIGTYTENPLYNASGDIKINESLTYETNVSGYIYCYGENGNFISRVATGNALPNGTAFVRINWLASTDAPYFISLSADSIQAQINALAELIAQGDEYVEDVYKINGDDILGYEIKHDGTIGPNENWRVSQFVALLDGKNYACNISANYYYYDEYFNFLGRISTTAGTRFNNSLYSGRAAYMRTNANINSPIEIVEIDANDEPILQYTLFKGYAENVLNGSESGINADVQISGDMQKQLPDISSNILVRFTTNQSIYKQGTTINLFSFSDAIVVNVSPIAQGDSYYCDKCAVNIDVIVNGVTQSIPLRLNNYGQDLFSIRIKYPVITVNLDGSTDITEQMPEWLQGAYLEKNDTALSIKKGDNTVFKSFVFGDYADIDAMVEAMKNDAELTQYFEIVKYGCEGITADKINNFQKVYLSKYLDEILYEQGNDTPTFTGKHYWDAYPTFVRTNDVGYLHTLKFNYRVIDGNIKTVFVSFDGMFVRFVNQSLMAKLVLKANTSGIIDEVSNLSIMPYKRADTPLLSMQHVVRQSDVLINQSMITSTMRQYDILSYLKSKGFAGMNLEEYISTIRGTNAVGGLAYCLTFDDYQREIWANAEIRNLFNQFRAKPTLVYLFVATDFSRETPPYYAPTKEEYDAIKKSGWGIVTHGFCMYSDMLGYAQFQQGFALNKSRWLQWYNEDVTVYNPHGAEITDFQFYLLKKMGFNSITSGSAYLGWFCESGTELDLEYKRVVWLDSELNWETVKQNIDNWLE